MYCFTHGFPTRNVASWLPGETTPWCGNPRCATLAHDLWPQMWQRGQGTVVHNVLWKLDTALPPNENPDLTGPERASRLGSPGWTTFPTWMTWLDDLHHFDYLDGRPSPPGVPGWTTFTT
eukprot:1653728-Karenia_brevis.AAC.1